MNIRIPPDIEKSSLIRIEGDPDGVQEVRKQLEQMGVRMVSTLIKYHGIFRFVYLNAVCLIMWTRRVAATCALTCHERDFLFFFRTGKREKQRRSNRTSLPQEYNWSERREHTQHTRKVSGSELRLPLLSSAAYQCHRRVHTFVIFFLGEHQFSGRQLKERHRESARPENGRREVLSLLQADERRHGEECF